MKIIVDNIATLYYDAPSNASREEGRKGGREEGMILKVALKSLKIWYV